MKLDDIPFIVKKMEEEMPLHTKTSCQVPSSFVRGLPKNLMDESVRMNDKFLNSHLAEIEETYHCFPDYHSKLFEQYQIKQYGNRDILNHDGFFTSKKIEDWIKENKIPMIRGSSLNLINPSRFGGCTQGTELETTATDNDEFPQPGFLIGSSVTATQDECYDQITAKFRTGSGSIHIGVYDSSGGDPINLEVTTGSISMFTNYAYKTVTEFNTDTAVQFIIDIWSANSAHRRQTSGSGRFRDIGFQALPDPFGTASNSSFTYRTKMRHS